MNKILLYSFEEYTEKAMSFHGYAAPGVLIGGFMVDLALRSIPKGVLYDVICETARCLPDAVQLLTPCTIGNQWLKIIDVGRYALAFYDKQTGKGIRVYLDHRRLQSWPVIRDWYLKLKPKKEQDIGELIHEISKAGVAMCGTGTIMVSPAFFPKRKRGGISICPSCQEAYPSARGGTCPACRSGLLPYVADMS